MLNKLNGTSIEWRDKLATYEESIQKIVSIMVESALEYDDFVEQVNKFFNNLLCKEEI